MLNYITAIPASKRLQKRIRDMLFREYELFRLQQQDAQMDDFILREAALIRHTIHVLSSLAQLDVLPRRQLPKPISRTLGTESVSHEIIAALQDVTGKLGFSKYAQGLIIKLYLDYAYLDAIGAEQPASLTAAIFLFAEMNCIDLDPITELYHVFGAKREEVRAALRHMWETLGCVSFDPRYLGEDGFVKMLYSVVGGQDS